MDALLKGTGRAASKIDSRADSSCTKLPANSICRPGRGPAPAGPGSRSGGLWLRPGAWIPPRRNSGWDPFSPLHGSQGGGLNRFVCRYSHHSSVTTSPVAAPPPSPPRRRRRPYLIYRTTDVTSPRADPSGHCRPALSTPACTSECNWGLVT